MRSTSDDILSASLPTDIYLVRHAEVHNPRDIVYGRLPRFGLSARGRAQAEAAGRFLAPRPVTAIYTSPLLRARETASILSRYHPDAPIRRNRQLIEVRTGFQGSPNSIFRPGFSYYEPLSDPGDETMADVFARMHRCLSVLARRHAGQGVVAVSHADPIVILRMGLERIPFSVANLHAAVYPVRASVTYIRVDAGSPLRLTYFNVADASA